MTLTDRDEAGKLFIGGLSWETTQEKLHEYFSRYGQVIDSVVMKNSATGRSRGFGFVTFSDPEVLPIVLSSGPHKLDGKTIDPKSCTPRSQQKGKGDSMPKLFLGGLPPGVTETEIRQAFSRFGKVHEVNIMYDQEKRKSRGFGFLSFESEDATHQACAQHFVDVNGKQIECKLAVPREPAARRGRPSQQQQPYQQSDSWDGRRMPSSEMNWPSISAASASAPVYSSGWGAAPPPPQQPYSVDGSYSAAYQGYNAPPPATTYSAYPPAAPAQYSQTGYSSYDTAGQMPPTSSTVSSGNYAATTADASGLGTYSQEPSQYGSTKSYSGGTDPSYSSYGNGQNQDYRGGSGYMPTGSMPAARSYGQQQSYHPYRR